MADYPQRKKVGALWTKTSKSNAANRFYAGQLELDGRDGKKIKIIVFKNGKKDKETSPDLIIYLDESEAPTKTPSKPVASKPQAPPPQVEDQLI
jgi:hypothetical protein